MAIYCPPKYVRRPEKTNEQLLSLKGELDDRQAKITLAQFLRANLGFTVELISGIKLVGYQELALKAFFNRNYSLCVWSRGGAKSFMAAVTSFLLPIFEPGCNVLIAGPTFRTARNIFSYLERIVDSPEANLLKQCFGAKSKRSDLFEWTINGGTIRAIPLNGEKIRGFRANVLILDEFLLLSADIIKNVLMPFLVAPTDIKQRIKIVEREERLIKEGKLDPSKRTVFLSTSRMIALSSASYTFENCYKVYNDWITQIMSNEPIKDATYFVSQIGFEALPEYFVEKTVIEEAKAGGQTEAAFQREYGAQFVDGSDSYFSARKMHEQTIKDGDKPTTLIAGQPNKEYILSIDPSFSQSPASDYFAMAVGEIDMENGSITLVHNYAVAGGELKDHIRYFYYLLKAFNIVLIIADSADGNFIASANESALFTNNNLKLNFIDYDGNLSGIEYAQMLKTLKNQYNRSNNSICFKHLFTSDSIRRINEQLQTFINTKKLWFASKMTSHDESYQAALATPIPYEFEAGRTIADLISDQDDLIYQVKKQCALIEVRVSPTGNQTFDLPASLRRNSSPNRARKDNYTALLLLVEGFRAYMDIMKEPASTNRSVFIPVMYGQTTYTA